MTQIIDRRKNSHGKSTENRQRFLKRVKGVIKEQLPKIIANRKIKDMGTSGGKVKVSRNRGITEPIFRHGDGGKRDYVIPGNKDFVPGDTIPKPRSGSGSSRGRQGSNEGQWEDDFIIELSQQELLDYLFEDLELPNLVQKQLTSMTETKSKHAGYNKDGSPNKLSVIRSFKQSLSRRIPAKSRIEKKITELEQMIIDFNNETLRLIETTEFNTPQAKEAFIEDRDIILLQYDWINQANKLKNKLTNIPFFDPIDLRYKQTVQYEIPTTHATMIMIMDNSGSMGQKEKTIARKFFFLLYAFLSKQYKNIDLRFISHTTDAKEMDEEEFFNTHESGGTVVSTALELTADIIEKDLMNKTNIYICQVSDGDNFSDDNGLCEYILKNDIMPFIQYYAYVQVDNYHEDENRQMTISNYLGFDKGLWESYQHVANEFENFQMKRVFEESDIYAVFKQLFEKKK